MDLAIVAAVDLSGIGKSFGIKVTAAESECLKFNVPNVPEFPYRQSSLYCTYP